MHYLWHTYRHTLTHYYRLLFKVDMSKCRHTDILYVITITWRGADYRHFFIHFCIGYNSTATTQCCRVSTVSFLHVILSLDSIVSIPSVIVALASAGALVHIIKIIIKIIIIIVIIRIIIIRIRVALYFFWKRADLFWIFVSKSVIPVSPQLFVTILSILGLATSEDIGDQALGNPIFHFLLHCLVSSPFIVPFSAHSFV